MNRKLTALVIGVGTYSNGASLPNPANDAEDIAHALHQLDFSVIKLIDPTLKQIDHAIVSFKDNLNSNDVGLFYFAGHGIQIKGENYLASADTNFVDESSAKYSSFPLNQLVEVMDSCSNKTNFIVLDACRNNPYLKPWNRGPGENGLANVYSPRGTLIAFATSPGEVAGDGPGRNGRFTEALLRHINTQDITVEDLFKRVRNTLYTITNGKQTSWEHTSLSGDFFFNLSAGRSIQTYGADAIADSLFPLTPNTPIREAIRSLKSYNWYTQNPGLDKLSVSDLASADQDSLFVLGRNIYQAACGEANSAIAYVRAFRTNVLAIPDTKSKSLLDGILFEIFFNSKGDLRKDFKVSRFNDVFEIIKFPEFFQSFEFISEVLIPHQSRFYVLPGKQWPVSVDVTTTTTPSGEYLITGVHFQGTNILRKLDGTISDDWGPYPTTFEKLVRTISTEMVVPENQLTVKTGFDDFTAKILLPYGVTLRK